jgi:hypothetical protein
VVGGGGERVGCSVVRTRWWVGIERQRDDDRQEGATGAHRKLDATADKKTFGYRVFWLLPHHTFLLCPSLILGLAIP